jgi:hypothetical protein
MGLFVQAAAVAVGEETGRRGEVMVEVTVGRRLSEQWRGRGDAAWRPAGTALACRTREAPGQARPKERGRRSWRTNRARGGSGSRLVGGSRPRVRPKEEEQWEKEGKKKKEKREKKKKKEIEKGK